MLASCAGFAVFAAVVAVAVTFGAGWRGHMGGTSGVASYLEAESATNEQLERIMPYLELRACRATPLSFVRGQLRVDALQARVFDATDAIKARSCDENE